MKIALLNSDWNNNYRKKHNRMGGVGYYRLWLPKLALEEATDWEVDFIGTEFIDMIDATSQETIAQSYVDFFNKYDAVVIKHFDNPNAGRFLVMASEHTGVPIITDLDDYVLGVREDQPAAKLGYTEGEVERTTVATMLSFSKGLLVTNDFLGKKVQEDIKNIFDIDLPYFVLPNYCNPEEWKFPTKLNKNKVVIGWHGSLTHDADLKMILPTIQRILKENPNVHLELLGGINKEFALNNFKDWGDEINRIKLIPGTEAWHNFPYHLCKQRWDIGIAPLIDDDFNKSKSNIKWLEYSLKGIPTIASNVEPYKSIEHGKTGYLAQNTDDWYKYLTQLIKSPQKRKKMAESAFAEVKNYWTYHNKGQMWKKAIKSVLKSNKKD